MNNSQAQSLLNAAGLSYLMEAAAVLATLTRQSQLDLHSSTHVNYAPTSHSKPTTVHPICPELPCRPVISTDMKTDKLYTKTEPNPCQRPAIASDNSKEIFPEKLMAVLNDPSLSEIITWLPHGRSFVIIRPDLFTERVMPKYFPPVDSRSSSKYTSFTRKLNRWGFRQATRGSDTGAFHHPLFQRDHPLLCLDMVCHRLRERVTSSSEKSTSPVMSPESSPGKPMLIKESLDKLCTKSQTNLNSPSIITPAAVSDDGRSTSSTSAPSGFNLSSTLLPSGTFSSFPSEITRDIELKKAAILKRNETERLRAAKAMLFASYCKAMRGE